MLAHLRPLLLVIKIGMKAKFLITVDSGLVKIKWTRYPENAGSRGSAKRTENNVESGWWALF